MGFAVFSGAVAVVVAEVVNVAVEDMVPFVAAGVAFATVAADGDTVDAVDGVAK